MTAASRYLIGLGAVGTGGLVAGLLAGPARAAVWAGAAIGLGLQGPLGWWLVRAVGRPRFFQVWGLGLLSRFGVLAAVGMVLLASDLPHAQAVLIALAGAFVALLGVEIAVLLGQRWTHEDV